MPNVLAASPCSQTAAAAASKCGMCCASRPVTNPPKTSPDPAVASHGGALALIAARPSGAAMTVSVALQDDGGARKLSRLPRAIDFRARKRTEQPFEFALVRRDHNRRLPTFDGREQHLAAVRIIAVAREKSHARVASRLVACLCE